MEIPQKFINWLQGSELMLGKKIKGTVALNEFKISMKDRFRELSKTQFYVWVTKYCEDNNIDLKVETKKDGKWFSVPNSRKVIDELDVSQPKHLSNKQLIDLTSSNFNDWLHEKEFRLWKTIVTTDMYRDYMEYAGSEYMTKQKFNEFLRFACIRLTGYLPYEGRCSSGKIMRFVNKGKKYDEQ